MKVTTDPAPILRELAIAHERAAGDVRDDIAAQLRGPGLVGTTVKEHTGHLADSFHVVEGGTRRGQRVLRITSDAVYADAVEHGANAREKASVRKGTKRRTTGTKKAGTYAVFEGPVFNRGTRRGPHMRGNHVVAEQGPRFIEHMTARLREQR